MLDMAFLSHRWHKREHVSRRRGVSRNAIRKYLRSEQIEARFQIPDWPSKVDPYAEKLSAWLRREENRPRKQRRTIKQLYGDLASLGYDGSYNRVAAFGRAWKEECKQLQRTAGRGTFVPLAFGPGEAFQFDWSEDFAVIGSTRTKLQVAHSKLCHSRAFTVRAYPMQTHEMLFDAHRHPFRVLGGVPRRGIYDNMRAAVDKVGRGKERSVSPGRAPSVLAINAAVQGSRVSIRQRPRNLGGRECVVPIRRLERRVLAPTQRSSSTEAIHSANG
jgi:transposase